jgi:tetratricopeptide (TPR) repeat protein
VTTRFDPRRASFAHAGDGLARELLPILPAAALAAFWLLSCFFSGAYFPSAWYPAAIVAVVLCPLLLAAGWKLPVGGARLSLALLGAFVAWTAISILWADAGGHALEATNKLVFALATTFVFALTPWTERKATCFVGIFVAGIAAASLVALLSAALATNPAGSFIDERYSEPMGSAGASAAFSALAVWPALALASRRLSPIWLRAAMFAIAVMQVDLALLPQSRGVVIALAVTTPLFLFLAPSRGWALLRLVGAAAIVALTVGPVLNVYTVANGHGSVPAALDSAVSTLAIAAALGLVLGLLLAWLERSRPELIGAARVRRARGPAIGLGVIAVVILAVVFGGRAGDQISRRWDEFKVGHVQASDSTSHLTTFGDPERYDYWRVALDAAEESPLNGVGAGNFQDVYTVERQDEKQSRYAHSIWLRVLSETGVVGLLLLLGSLGLALAVLIRRRRHLPAAAQLLIAGSLSASMLVFVHASVDWIEEFPAVLGPALALLFVACRVAAPPAPGPPRRQAAGLVAGLVVAGVALAGLVPAYLSLRFVERAEAAAVTDPGAAYTDIDRAAYLNPFSSQPDLTLGEIAIAHGEYARGRNALETAIEKEDNWYPHFELATLASQRGRSKEALAQMKIALSLDSVDPLVQESLATIRHGRRLELSATHAKIRSEAADRFFHLRNGNSGSGR